MNTKHQYNRSFTKTTKIHFQNPDNTQKITDYTEQELTGSSSTINIYQKTTNKAQLPK